MKETIKEIIKNVGLDDNLNIATTNLEVFEGEVLEKDFDYKRVFHFIVLDKKDDLKPYFRALRNGGYLISLVKFEEEYLYDIGFSAVSEIDGIWIMKKVHSWNDW